jgi:tRNA pseudouridine38-40 synthase
MPTYRLTLEYDGTGFHGWQAQPRARTVEGALRDALRHLGEHSPRLTAAGRTDAGAHAHGQTAGVTLRREWDAASLAAALNAHLPEDVAVVSAAASAPEFHARYDALSRTYRYVIRCGGARAALARDHVWTVRGPLDVGAMRKAALALLGTHDFASFGAATAPRGTTVRTVHEATVDRVVIDTPGDRPALDVIAISVRADAFLRGMMRGFAGALVAVGHRRLTAASFAELVRVPGNRARAITVAPARGLHQWAVAYEEAA